MISGSVLIASQFSLLSGSHKPSTSGLFTQHNDCTNVQLFTGGDYRYAFQDSSGDFSGLGASKYKLTAQQPETTLSSVSNQGSRFKRKTGSPFGEAALGLAMLACLYRSRV